MTPTGFALHLSTTATIKTKDQHLNPFFISHCRFRCSFPLIRRGNAKSVTVNAITSVWLMFGGSSLFVCLFSPFSSPPFSIYSSRESLTYLKNHEREDPAERAAVTIKQKLSDTKVPLSGRHMHTRSPICRVPITHLHGARRMAGRNQLQHTCLLLSNSLLLFPELWWPQAAGDGDTCNSSHPLAQIPTPFFFVFVCVRLQTLPRTLIHCGRTVPRIRLTLAWSSFFCSFQQCHCSGG